MGSGSVLSLQSTWPYTEYTGLGAESCEAPHRTVFPPSVTPARMVPWPDTRLVTFLSVWAGVSCHLETVTEPTFYGKNSSVDKNHFVKMVQLIETVDLDLSRCLSGPGRDHSSAQRSYRATETGGTESAEVRVRTRLCPPSPSPAPPHCPPTRGPTELLHVLREKS